MPMYKTPGVYVEEIPKFPPSIAPVETAIPAFVGYTEKADKTASGDLLNLPTKIGSLTEYEFYFGAGAKLNVEAVILDYNKSFKSAKIKNQFYMYDSLRLFYANGGGDCYIVSVGTYDSQEGQAPHSIHFTADGTGIKTLEKFDEPTILVFPDNSRLTTDYKEVYDAALAQCGSLKDRVGLFHVNEDDHYGADFRSKTGLKELKYGMAYSPWLEVSFPKNITYRDFFDKIYKGSTSTKTKFKLTDLADGTTGNNEASASLILAYKAVSTDVDTVASATTALRGSYPDLQARFDTLKNAYETSKIVNNFMPIMGYLFDFARQIDTLVGTSLTSSVQDIVLKDSLKTRISSTTSSLKKIYADLINYDQALAAAVTTYNAQYSIDPLPLSPEWGSTFSSPPLPNLLFSGNTNSAKMKEVLDKIDQVSAPNNLFDQIKTAWEDVIKAAKDAKTSRFKALVSAFPMAALIVGYETVMTDVDHINAETTSLPTDATKTLRDHFSELEGEYLSEPVSKASKFQNIVDYLFKFARTIDTLVGSTGVHVQDDDLKNDLTKLIKNALKGIYAELISYDKALPSKEPNYTAQFQSNLPKAAEWGGVFSENSANNPDFVQPSSNISGTNGAAMDDVLSKLRPLFDQINDAWLGSVVGAAQQLEKAKHEGMADSFPLYKTILTGLQNATTSVPPSGAVAGIYAYVDRTRGVWKAPANVSISGIIGPTITFTASELDALNVDPTSGKSINAIRSFTGKGTLVYGARTLTGNDNEWRYVSVRRFFNFVEESTKKATEQFVFEPNDANTWVRIQAMIENFLTTLWRQGALQGIKPEHAFYVAVGLGKTMTPIDILEGRLIIEIGMAVVRPAEFIILKFSHKMAES